MLASVDRQTRVFSESKAALSRERNRVRRCNGECHVSWEMYLEV